MARALAANGARVFLNYPDEGQESRVSEILESIKASGGEGVAVQADVSSEEQVLIKSFKYFDLNDSGEVEPDEFAKAIEKIGIMIPTKQVSKSAISGSDWGDTLFPFLFDILNYN